MNENDFEQIFDGDEMPMDQDTPLGQLYGDGEDNE